MKIKPRKSQFALSESQITNFFHIGLVIILLLTALAINRSMIFNGIKFTAHDSRIHIVWLQHFYRHLTEGILYPRWLAGTNFGYGSPSFVFYPPLVYYIGSVFRFLGLNIEQTIIALYVTASFGSGLSFYLYARYYWHKWSSLLGAIIYLAAPYIVLNSHVRGALAETWALIWLPLIPLVIEKTVKDNQWGIVLSLLAAIVALTHVPSLILYTIISSFYIVSFIFRKYSIKNIFFTFIFASLGLGFVSFYLLPAIMEKSLVSIKTMKGVSGGFQANLIGTPVEWVNKFMLNDIQPIFIYSCIGILVFTILIIWLDFKNVKTIKTLSYWLFFAFAIGITITYPSVKLWNKSEILQMVQFPWRLMGIFTFTFTGIFTFLINKIIIIKNDKNKYAKIFMIVIIACICIYHFKFSYQITHRNPGWKAQNSISEINKFFPDDKRKSMIKDALYNPYQDNLKDTSEYLPLTDDGKSAPLFPEGNPKISILSGKAQFQIEKWHSYQRKFQINVQEKCLIEIKSYYYPAWHLFVNKQLRPILVSQDATIQVQLEQGAYQVELRYLWTKAFKIGTTMSILSLLIFLKFYAWIYTKQKVQL